jgi:uncharacterized repeat protein (TIGR03803 family)
MKKNLYSFLTLCLLAVSTLQAQYTKLLDFAGASNGSNPFGSLLSDGNALYGMTLFGGTNNLGTAFKINPDGTGYTKLLDFAGASNGSEPRGSLISDGTSLYGMTYLGGTNNQGTVFKINPDGTGYTKLLDFAGASNGSYPSGSLLSDGTSLYGVTASGGANNLGTIFKINPDGTGYTKLLDFAGASNGRGPLGTLISDGTSLYGMTRDGGTNNLGTVFKINPDGTGYTKLLDFNGASNGKNPHGSLLFDGISLYGTTMFGGTNDLGTIFKINPDGTGYTKLLDFAVASNGTRPEGSLLSDGISLYGMTRFGGTNDLGTIFKINPDGTDYTILLNFAGSSNGSDPRSVSLISDGTSLYGMTHQGGTSNLGTVFKYQYCFPPTADAPSNVSACDSYTLPSLTVGNYFTATNGGGSPLSAGVSITSTQTLYVYAVNGSCSDENSFEVSITPLPSNTVSKSGNTLTADEADATYQWLDCDNGNAPISDADSQTYTISASGNYAVEVTKNGCSSTSTCTSVSFVGINENSSTAISVYPNPSTGKFTIVAEQLGKNYRVTDNIGKVVAEGTINNTQTDIDLSNSASGLYLLTIEGHVYKLVKQ